MIKTNQDIAVQKLWTSEIDYSRHYKHERNDEEVKIGKIDHGQSFGLYFALSTLQRVVDAVSHKS